MQNSVRSRFATKGVAVIASLVTALCVAAVYAIGASAAITVYCNKIVGPGDSCDVSVVYQHFQQNVAQYNGAGTVSVCQKLTVGGVNQNRTCGNGFASSPLGNWGEMRGWVGNNSANNHTIDGIATGTN